MSLGSVLGCGTWFFPIEEQLYYYKNYCYLPLFIFEGTSHALVMAFLRPGKRPPGAENAMILVRLLSYLRRHWPTTHILVRGDSHFATPEVIEVIAHRRRMDFVFGLAGNPVLLRQATPVMQDAHDLPRERYAAPLRVWGLCPPSCPPYPHARPHHPGHGPTLDRDSHALQSGHAGQTIQGPDSLAPADLMPRQSAVAPGDNAAHS